MDLFYQQDTLQEQLKTLKTNLKDHASKLGFKLDRKFKILHGNADAIGNNIFIIMPPFMIGSEYFKGKEIEFLLNILNEHNIYNFFLTYACLFPYKIIGRKNIADFSYWIKLMIDIVQPHTIVVLGEQAPFTFIKRKVILKEAHGTILDYYNQIPIILTYHMSYFTNSTQYEDLSYKTFLRNSDWSFIETRYRKFNK